MLPAAPPTGVPQFGQNTLSSGICAPHFEQYIPYSSLYALRIPAAGHSERPAAVFFHEDFAPHAMHQVAAAAIIRFPESRDPTACRQTQAKLPRSAWRHSGAGILGNGNQGKAVSPTSTYDVRGHGRRRFHQKGLYMLRLRFPDSLHLAAVPELPAAAGLHECHSRARASWQYRFVRAEATVTPLFAPKIRIIYAMCRM